MSIEGWIVMGIAFVVFLFTQIGFKYIWPKEYILFWGFREKRWREWRELHKEHEEWLKKKEEFFKKVEELTEN